MNEGGFRGSLKAELGSVTWCLLCLTDVQMFSNGDDDRRRCSPISTRDGRRKRGEAASKRSKDEKKIARGWSRHQGIPVQPTVVKVVILVCDARDGQNGLASPGQTVDQQSPIGGLGVTSSAI